MLPLNTKILTDDDIEAASPKGINIPGRYNGLLTDFVEAALRGSLYEKLRGVTDSIDIQEIITKQVPEAGVPGVGNGMIAGFVSALNEDNQKGWKALEAARNAKMAKAPEGAEAKGGSDLNAEKSGRVEKQ